MKNTAAKLEALSIRWDVRATNLQADGDTVGAEVIWNNVEQLQKAIRNRQDLTKVAERWRKAGLEPWIKMGKELATMLSEK